MRMVWRDAVFLSWRVHPDEVARRLPSGLQPDLLDEAAWVSVVAFQMDRKRILGGLRVWRNRFTELNVRTYVQAGGVAGIRFLSMDTPSRAVTAVGRAMGLPYRLARLGMSDLRYWDEPRGQEQLAFRVLPGRQRDPTPVDRFLLERYVAFAGAGRRRLHVHHAPWPVHEAEVEGFAHGFLGKMVGFRPPDHVAYSPGVDAGAWYRFGSGPKA